MTIVDISSAEPSAAPPRRRALLPRNPTPWAPQEPQALPPQVQRLLQQIGGSTYRTYQPFQVLQPFILPENNPVPTLPHPDTPHSPSSSSTSPVPPPFAQNDPPSSRPLSGDFLASNHTNNSNSTVTQSTQNSHAPRGTDGGVGAGGIRAHSPGAHDGEVGAGGVSAIVTPAGGHSTGVTPGGGLSAGITRTGGLSPGVTPAGGVDGPPPLTHLCRNLLVSHFGLRALRQLLLLIQAPKSVAKFLSTINAKECIVRSSAPLLDVFAEPFFHRAVTWRVVCSLDGQPYLATYAHTDVATLQDGRWVTACWGEGGGDTVGGAWLWCDHPHIMRVWGLVLDDVTGNTFYLLDTPIATLDQIQSRLTLWSVRVPEPLIWCVVASLTSALRHTLSQGLQYTPLLLSNVFLLQHTIAIENGLTRKKQLTGCSGCTSSPHGRPPQHRPASEACLVHHVGQVIFALITCHLRTTWTNMDQPHHNTVSYVKMMHVLREEYSGVLLRLLSRTLNGGLARAWAAAGGGQDGLVADRTARWEHTTRGRAKQHNSTNSLTILQEPLLPEPLPLPLFGLRDPTVPCSPSQNTSENLLQKNHNGQTDYSISAELPNESTSPHHSRIPSPVPHHDARSESRFSYSAQMDEVYSSGILPSVKDAFDDGVRNEIVDGELNNKLASYQGDGTKKMTKSKLVDISVKVESERKPDDKQNQSNSDNKTTRDRGHRSDTKNVSSSTDHSTRPKTKPRDRRHTGDRRPKKHHKSSSSPNSELRISTSSKENISPNVNAKTSKTLDSEPTRNRPLSKENLSCNDSTKRMSKTRDSKLKNGYGNPETAPGYLVTDCTPVSLAHIAQLAEEQVVERCEEGNLADALKSCPQRLVHLALSQQP